MLELKDATHALVDTLLSDNPVVYASATTLKASMGLP